MLAVTVVIIDQDQLLSRVASNVGVTVPFLWSQHKEQSRRRVDSKKKIDWKLFLAQSTIGVFTRLGHYIHPNI